LIGTMVSHLGVHLKYAIEGSKRSANLVVIVLTRRIIHPILNILGFLFTVRETLHAKRLHSKEHDVRV
ncbi:MAG: hypothetical protein PHH90_05940, partial [Limnochordia bacterium]|nr:hypothetical protein [Limnochordia bacterium]